jgi:ABC-type iron transport system FetAB ATPase subunit
MGRNLRVDKEMILKLVPRFGKEDVDWIYLAHDKNESSALANTRTKLRRHKRQRIS